MRYSVVLPRIESTDAEDARRALGHAQELWTQGEQRAALAKVKQAAESARAVGQKDRALALSRAVALLARAIGSSSVRPPAIPDGPAVSAPRMKVNSAATPEAATEPPSHSKPLHSLMRATVPAKPDLVASLLATERAMPAVAAVAPVVPFVAAPVETSALDATEDAELVVTIAPAGWGLASPSALVGHRAERVAVAPGRGPGGTLMVRPLKPGEVAPKGSMVAVMVTLESDGSLPLSRVS